jgi:hypothetical protein
MVGTCSEVVGGYSMMASGTLGMGKCPRELQVQSEMKENDEELEETASIWRRQQ